MMSNTAANEQARMQAQYANDGGALGATSGQPMGATPPSGRQMLQNRAASFRYAADQIDRLLGMTPAELTAEQEQALLFLGQNTQFVF